MIPEKLSCYLQGIAVAAPGLANWSHAQKIFSLEKEYRYEPSPFPTADILPPREKRRASPTVNLSLHLAETAQKSSKIDPQQLRTVFATSDGDSDIFDYLCRNLAEDQPAISPTLFHQSLHNSAAGYYGIAVHSYQASLSISAGDETFSAGLFTAAMEATAHQAPVLLVSYNLPYPAPMDRHYPMLTWFGVSLVLSPVRLENSWAKLDLQLVQREKASVLSMPSLEILKEGNLIAKSLPFLAALSAKKNARIYLDYLPPSSLEITLEALA